MNKGHPLGDIDSKLDRSVGVDDQASALVEDCVEAAHWHVLADDHQVGGGVAAADHR